MLEQYTVEEYLEHPREEFEVPADVLATLQELATAMLDICKRNNVPAAIFVAEKSDTTTYRMVRTQCLPIERTPAEMLVCDSLIARGLLSGLKSGAAMLRYKIMPTSGSV